MKPKLAAMILIALILFTATSLGVARLAGYSLPWWTVDSGGGDSQGGDYILSGTIGQPDAKALSGGNYHLEGGFWGGVISSHRVYLPLILKP